MPMIGLITDDRGKWLLVSAAANNVSGTAMDARAASNWAYLYSECTGNSAIFDILVSPDNLHWNTALSVTATNGGTATAQVSAFWPYVNAATRAVYSAAGGSANLNIYYRPL